MTINCQGKLIDLSSPKVMGILNITPDSFHDGGQFIDPALALKQAEKMLADGADFIDIGGMSSRPGAEIITIEEELNRVLPVVQNIARHLPQATISVDTLRAEVAEAVLKAGAHIINDISAGRYDAQMLETVARYKTPFIIMHMQGLPADMQHTPHYADVVSEVYDFFAERIKACRKAGILDTILDPGYGFGKTLEHNYALLRNQSYFANLRQPMLAGLSRKSMICKVLHVNPDKALNGTTAANMLALLNGAQILRVHDVKEAVECVKIWKAYSK
jgi:dihydropteroate synthase